MPLPCPAPPRFYSNVTVFYTVLDAEATDPQSSILRERSLSSGHVTTSFASARAETMEPRFVLEMQFASLSGSTAQARRWTESASSCPTVLRLLSKLLTCPTWPANNKPFSQSCGLHESLLLRLVYLHSQTVHNQREFASFYESATLIDVKKI